MTIRQLQRQFAGYKEYLVRDQKRQSEDLAEIGVSFCLVFDSLPGSLRAKAKKMGLSPAYLSDVCNGKRNVTEDLINRLERLK